MTAAKKKAAPAAEAKKAVATAEALEVACAGCKGAAELIAGAYPVQTTPDGKRWRLIHSDPSDGESTAVWVCSRDCETGVTGK